MNYKPWYALGEFVDNSIQSWRGNRSRLEAVHGPTFKLRIEIQFDHAGGRIVVRDNAAGIRREDIGRAFKPAQPPADRSGLSQFGIGMKSAACWYARVFEVVTEALDEDVSRALTFDVPALIEADQDLVPVVEAAKTPDRHGTAVVLRDLYHPIPTGRTLGKLRSYLASIYREYLLGGHVEILVGEERLTYREPPVLNAPRWDAVEGAAETWRKPLSVTLPSGRNVAGWAALRAKGSTAEAGLALIYRGKVVLGAGAMAGSGDDVYRPELVFGRGNTFMSQRLFGELDVSELRVTYSKDAIIWAGEEEVFLDLLRDALDEEPLPLLKMAQAYRSTERGKEAQDILATAVKATAEAMGQALAEEASTAKRARSQPSEDAGKAIPASAPVEASVPVGLHATLDDLRLEVVDEELDPRWLRVVSENGVMTVAVNRSHRFMQSFAHVPGADVEPVLRLAAALALAELRGRTSGHAEPAFVRHQVNDLLDGALAERLV